MNQPLNVTKSWFERFITPSIKQNAQLRLNTTSNRKSNYALNEIENIANVTSVASEHLVTLNSNELFARGILVGQDGTEKI